MASTIWKENDLSVWNDSGRFFCAFTHIENQWSWLRGGSTSKGLDSASLKLMTIARCGDPKLLAYAMKSHPGVEDFNTRYCVLEGSELFGSTKQEFGLPPDVDRKLHQSNKVNYSIPRPNTRVRRACIHETLNYAEHGVTHSTLVLEINCFSSHLHIARLPSNSAKRC